jgi:hypothetical protein
VINPARTGEIDTRHLSLVEWHDFIAAAILRMRSATAIHFLPGWQESYGARIEHLVAMKMGLVLVEVHCG